MKALLLKDFYMLQKLMKMMGVMVVFYATIFISTGSTDALSFILVIFAATFPISSLNFDEANNWDRYALCGPLSRRDMVLAKYALSLLLQGGMLLFCLLFYGLLQFFTPTRPLADTLFMLATEVCLGLLGLAIIIPFIYKLGSERGRLLLMAVVMIPVLVFILYAMYAPPALKLLVESNLRYFPAALGILAVVGFYLSYRISLRIYMNKDF